jgi:hypothetical protein
MLKFCLVVIGALISVDSLAQVTASSAYLEASFKARDGRVQQAILDSINQGLSIKVNGEDLNTVQLKQRKSRNLSVSDFATVEKWSHLCSDAEGVEKWAASQCMAFAHIPLKAGECGREEWCLKFEVADFIRNDPGLLDIVRKAISSPCSYAQSTQPGPSSKNGGRGVLPPGEAKNWLFCDAKNPIFGIKKSEVEGGVFVLSISRAN